jgi:hypothetical protein
MNNNLETREDENINENGEIIYNDFTKWLEAATNNCKTHLNQQG